MSDKSYTSTSIQPDDKQVQDAIAQTYRDAGEGAGARRYMLVALVLLILPFLAILQQSYKVDNGTLIRLPVKIGTLEHSETENYIPTKLFSTVELSTALNRISTKQLTGNTAFRTGESIYVFLSPGPNDIWYPYAVSKRAPRGGCYVSSCLILNGHIRSTEQGVLNIRYQYENYVPTPEMIATFTGRELANAELFLSVDKNGRTHVRAINIDGQQIDQRNLPIEALLGLTSRIASNAPTK